MRKKKKPRYSNDPRYQWITNTGFGKDCPTCPISKRIKITERVPRGWLRGRATFGKTIW